MIVSYYDVSIELTYNCNFKCVHCYNSFCNNDPTCLTYTQIVDIERKLQKFDIVGIYLTGGEPLLHPSFKQIYRYLYRQGYQIYVASNGYFIDHEIIDMFKSYPPHTFNISIYGYDMDSYKSITSKDAYEKIMSNIRELKKHKLQFFIKYVALKHNSCSEKVYSLLKKINAPCSVYYEMAPYRDASGEGHNFHLRGSLLNEMIHCSSQFKHFARFFIVGDGHSEFSNCQIWAKSFIISPQGYVRSCIPCYSGDSYNILINDLDDITDYLRSAHEQNCRYPEICTGCNIKSHCKCPLILKKYKCLNDVCEIANQIRIAQSQLPV